MLFNLQIYNCLCLNGVEKFRVAETFLLSAIDLDYVSTELRSSGWLKLPIYPTTDKGPGLNGVEKFRVTGRLIHDK